MKKYANFSFTDEELLNGLKSGSRKMEDRCFNYLYISCFAMINKYILNNNGSVEDARDIFQNAIMSFYENLKSGNYKHTAKISTYLFEIAKNRWMNELNHRKVISIHHKNESESKYETDPECFYIHNEKSRIIENLFNKIKEDCKKILVYSIYYKYSMDEIAKIMNLKNSQVARNKKNICLNGLKDIIKKSNPLLKELHGIYFNN